MVVYFQSCIKAIEVFARNIREEFVLFCCLKRTDSKPEKTKFDLNEFESIIIG
jgi:hypothetical protein